MPPDSLTDAGTAKVVRVVVDVPLAHLDRLFDYSVPDRLLGEAVPGCRVKVPFAGKIRDGWLLDETTQPATSKLSSLHRVVSSEPVLTEQLYRLLRAVADHYAGVLPDVLRLAIPARHAATERAHPREWEPPREGPPPRVLPSFPHGATFLDALRQGRSPRAAWLAPAVADTVGDLAGGAIEAADACLASGRSVVVTCPTLRELEPTVERFTATFGRVGVLNADAGPSTRYRNFLAAARGQARIVLGTRSAVVAPVRDLGLVVVIDEGNDAYAERRAPYPHAREVAALRAAHEGCGLLLAGHGRSVEAQGFVERGWVSQLQLTPGQTRRVSPPVRVIGEVERQRDPSAARLRLPSDAFGFLRDKLPAGPVLVQVPRAGHAAALACQRCRERASCPRCSGPLVSRTGQRIECALCGLRPPRWECAYCHGTQLRAPLVGAGRTAEELARAFPGTVAINSSAERIRTDVPDEPAIVVATPGAEPTAPSGYSGALLLDGDVMLARADLRVGEESLRRWAHAAALVRPPGDGGSVMLVGSSGHPGIQALVRGDVAGYVSRELADRLAAGLPPAVKAVRVGGDPAAVAEFLDNDPFEGVEVLGPTVTDDGREPEAVALLRAPLERGRDLVARTKHASAIRSARKEGGRLYVQVDPAVME
ncbi:MAG: hypothetical protein ACK5KO_13970 [Arachnia sp.]